MWLQSEVYFKKIKNFKFIRIIEYQRTNKCTNVSGRSLAVNWKSKIEIWVLLRYMVKAMTQNFKVNNR